MSSYVSAPLRRRVAERAGYLCEYCLIAENDTFFGCEVDHVISEKHGGETVAENLAYACVFCNRYKGSDVGSIDWETRTFSRLFDPRRDAWPDHFTLDGVLIQPRTTIGQVTVRLLRLNAEERRMEREALRVAGRYPSSATQRRLSE